MIGRDTRIILAGSLARLRMYKGEVDSRTFSELIVESGNAVLSFAGTLNNRIFIDDLVIEGMAILTLDLYYPNSGDGLFVKKTSAHLADALAKIHVTRVAGRVGVKDYNEEYWLIGAGAGFHPIPEPAMYGAGFSLCALGFVAWRRRRRRTHRAVSLAKQR